MSKTQHNTEFRSNPNGGYLSRRTGWHMKRLRWFGTGSRHASNCVEAATIDRLFENYDKMSASHQPSVGN